jgi:hypothetical protein
MYVRNIFKLNRATFHFQFISWDASIFSQDGKEVKIEILARHLFCSWILFVGKLQSSVIPIFFLEEEKAGKMFRLLYFVIVIIYYTHEAEASQRIWDYFSSSKPETLKNHIPRLNNGMTEALKAKFFLELVAAEEPRAEREIIRKEDRDGYLRRLEVRKNESLQYFKTALARQINLQTWHEDLKASGMNRTTNRRLLGLLDESCHAVDMTRIRFLESWLPLRVLEKEAIGETYNQLKDHFLSFNKRVSNRVIKYVQREYIKLDRLDAPDLNYNSNLLLHHRGWTPHLINNIWLEREERAQLEAMWHGPQYNETESVYRDKFIVQLYKKVGTYDSIIDLIEKHEAEDRRNAAFILKQQSEEKKNGGNFSQILKERNIMRSTARLREYEDKKENLKSEENLAWFNLLRGEEETVPDNYWFNKVQAIRKEMEVDKKNVRTG